MNDLVPKSPSLFRSSLLRWLILPIGNGVKVKYHDFMAPAIAVATIIHFIHELVLTVLHPAHPIGRTQNVDLHNSLPKEKRGQAQQPIPSDDYSRPCGSLFFIFLLR